jgi:8-oxo-dGTP pyrophosphatase MutT (NUDIX family)
MCQNCGVKGHHIRHCPNPVTSLGIILYSKKTSDIEFLLVRRKNTIGFVEFIRGKYATNDIEYIQELFNVMTEEEINLIQDNNFEYLWEFLWMDKKFNKGSNKVKRDFETASNKFNKIRTGYGEDNNINIVKFINDKSKFYIEQEWGFPKGRRNFNENNFNAALREFIEETGITKKDIICSPTSTQFEEAYISYDNISYKNIYYIAEYTGSGKITIDNSKHEQFTEVSNIKFFGVKTILDKFRDYDIEKKKLISTVHKHLTT